MSNLLNSLSSGYEQAQEYYARLKDKMLDEMVLKMKMDPLLQAAPNQLRDRVEAEIQSYATNWDDNRSKALRSLEKVEVAVAKIIEKQDMSGLTNLMQQLQKEAEANSNDQKTYIRQLKDSLKKHQSYIIQQVLTDHQFFNNIIATTTADTTDIQNQLSSYFVRYLYTQLMQSQEISGRIQYELSLGGFYKEAAEYEILERKFRKMMNVFHAGSKNTELDIIITTLDNMEAAFQGNESVTKIISMGDFNDLGQDLIQQITWYGEQVKSWSLNANTNIHSIGNRQALFQAYLDERNVTQDYDTVASALFLGRFKNILLALGPTNVLFSSGGQRQWMSDFIADMRAKSFVLVFGRPNDKSPLTAKVNIERVMTLKGNIRNRFQI